MKSPEKGLDDLLRSCTVRIKAGTIGTGFFVAPGLILTCAHVVKKAKSEELPINIHWKDQDYPVQVKSLLPDTYPDLALLSVNLQRFAVDRID